MGSQKIYKYQIIIPLLYAILTAIILVASPSMLFAKVTGSCANCHTMHNSQNGDDVDGSGPNGRLLNSSCVGCHSSPLSSTIVSLGGSNIPIVYNTGGYPATPLAGGNFYYVSSGSPKVNKDSYGHNVYGVAGQDSVLSQAPGKTGSGACGGNSCHMTLAAAPSNENFYLDGCQGCHVFTYHHEDNAVYRFLKGHGSSPPTATLPLPPARKNIATYADYVTGVEDSDWEYTNNASDHNFYKGTTTNYSSSGTALTNRKTITAFCSGCHYDFHGPYDDIDKTGMGSSSPWMRHPTDIALPDTDEYGEYDPDPVGGEYTTETPVAWVTPSSPVRSQAIVMCLSCHRAHGSDQPDMLRWDYSTSEIGGSGGCLNCHTSK